MGDWVLDGGRPSIDLLNTVRDRAEGGRETLCSPADLTAWLGQIGLPGGTGSPGGQAPGGQAPGGQTGVEPGDEPDRASEADLRTARRLRAAIDLLAFPAASRYDDGPERAMGGPVSPMPGTPAEAVDVINATGVARAPRLGLDGHGRLVAVPPEPSVAAGLAHVALDAIDLLTGGEPLRVCAASDCGIRFADRSPARNRQWCSMRRCGNRTKARRHYVRARG